MATDPCQLCAGTGYICDVCEEPEGDCTCEGGGDPDMIVTCWVCLGTGEES